MHDVVARERHSERRTGKTPGRGNAQRRSEGAAQNRNTTYTRCHFLFFLSSHPLHSFQFNSYMVGGFTLSRLLVDKPWPQVSSLPPPRYVPSLFVAA